MTSTQFPAHAPLAVQTRGSIVESVHYGSLAAVKPDGWTLLSRGEPTARMYPRSALKPLMAVAMLRAGVDLTDQQLA
uniref:asparaginase n=1 Tax=Arthrobacter sp. TaxID=1667 RepID=UPI002585E32A